MGVYNRNGIWYIRTWRGRKEIRRAVGRSKRQAELYLGKIKAEIAEGKFLDPLKGNKITYGELLDRYLKEHSAVHKGAESYREDTYLVRELKAAFGELLLKDVTLERVSPWIQELREKGKGASSINHRINMLKHSLKLAKEWGLIRHSPVADLKRLREPAGRLRYLEARQFQRLLTELPDYLRSIVVVAAHTGMRLGEILSLRWEQVNLSQRVVTLTHTKNGRMRGVPLNATAMGVFRELARERMREEVKSLYVFTNPLTGDRWIYISRAFNSAVERAKIQDFRFHDLRHTAASWMVMSGVDLLTVAEILGHKDTRMTERYSHLSPAHCLDAVSKLDMALAGAEAPSDVTQPAQKPAQ
jgi:integrase